LTKYRDRERNRYRKKLHDLSQPNPYSLIELAKHIDPIFLDDLKILQFRTLKPVVLTVVFWDVSGFSDLCIELYYHPNGINLFLNEYFKMAIKIIKKHHGVLDKFMGDGILAYFGYNGSGDRDIFNAISAAIEFRKRFPTLKKSLAQYCKRSDIQDIGRIDLKCGINYGPAYAYYFNTPMRNSVILLGSTLNFASRLEGIAQTDEIIVSEDVMNMIREKYELKTIRGLKGKIKSFEEVNVVYLVKGIR
jgi:class 3 adenylate cyclase